MKLLRGEQQIKVFTTKKPKFSWRGGRTWDTNHIIIDGEKVILHYDSTWGMWGYFYWDDRWRKINLIDTYTAFDLDFRRTQNFTTKVY